MSTPAQIGKNEYRAALEDARSASQELRVTLKRIIQEGDSVIRALVGQAAISLVELSEALNRLEEIGRNTKGE
jgi:hypothetical protein